MIYDVDKAAIVPSIDDVLEFASDKELLNIDFVSDVDNITRDHKLIKSLYDKIRILEAKVARLEGKVQ